MFKKGEEVKVTFRGYGEIKKIRGEQGYGAEFYIEFGDPEAEDGKCIYDGWYNEIRIVKLR